MHAPVYVPCACIVIQCALRHASRSPGRCAHVQVRHWGQGWGRDGEPNAAKQRRDEPPHAERPASNARERGGQSITLPNFSDDIGTSAEAIFNRISRARLHCLNFQPDIDGQGHSRHTKKKLVEPSARMKPERFTQGGIDYIDLTGNAKNHSPTSSFTP